MSSIKDNSIIQLVSLCPEVKWRIRPLTEDEKTIIRSNNPDHPEMVYALELPGHRIWATQKEILEFFGWYPFREDAEPTPKLRKAKEKDQPEINKHGLRWERLDQVVSNRTATEVLQDPPKFPKLTTKPKLVLKDRIKKNMKEEGE